MKITDKHVFFWGEWPSNWYPCTFNANVDGKTITFYNSEQYFMYMKAKTFNDEEIAEKILKDGHNPRKAKKLGREVKNYDDNTWNQKRYQVMVEANYHKFKNNQQLKQLLLSTTFKNKHFVEASPIDKIWGIGCSETNAKDDKSNWNGLNLLGKTLDEVREMLMQEK